MAALVNVVGSMLDAMVAPALARRVIESALRAGDDLSAADWRDRRFVVTGANTGVACGAAALAAQGARVDLVCRDPGRGHAAAEPAPRTPPQIFGSCSQI